ncbi:MAG: NADPH-dependent F420 reductase [Oenococcus sp.]|uniref:NADPH-dependent F420 reductase n=2 Tax=Lactobacillaceae TaxID=33958 RepID=UPI0021E99A15|nr:NADPH-dependent F420 reductase [Oenococcus kitaharae]MCV3295657.1 NADPH-dependent F420 reductase [Oenococcus kitaharae]
MTEITIFGKGNMGKAIGGNFADGGNAVTYLGHSDRPETLGDIVVLAVPYPALKDIAEKYVAQLVGKIVIDITNPVNFDTFDSLTVPTDSSAAQELAQLLPDAKIVKGFNTNFASTLLSKKIGDAQTTTVLLASDHDAAKETIAQALSGSNLAVVDAGSLKRAKELEEIGFFQMTLAASEKISWNGGFTLLK